MQQSIWKWMLFGAASVLAASAQAQFPTKPIRLIVPFPAGGTADFAARVITQPISQALSQTIVVDDRGGADGAVAGLLVMNAQPDGYTLFFATNSPMSAVPTLHRNPPYDVMKDFTPITMLGRFTFFLFTTPSLPARSVKELIEYAKANPGKLNYGTGNTTAIIATAQMKALTGTDMQQIPYKGDAPTTADMLGGRIQLAFMSLSPGFAQAKEGKLRMLAVLLEKRTPLAPDVPTLTEAGLPGITIAPWAGLFGPAKLPKPIVDQLSREFGAALNRPEVRQQLSTQGFEAEGSTPQKLADFTYAQLGLWTKIIREANIPME